MLCYFGEHNLLKPTHTWTLSRGGLTQKQPLHYFIDFSYWILSVLKGCQSTVV